MLAGWKGEHKEPGLGLIHPCGDRQPERDKLLLQIVEVKLQNLLFGYGQKGPLEGGPRCLSDVLLPASGISQ